jgi:hypothetical protein
MQLLNKMTLIKWGYMAPCLIFCWHNWTHLESKWFCLTLRITGFLNWILYTRKHKVSETRFAFILRWGEGDTYSVGSLRKLEDRTSGHLSVPLGWGQTIPLGTPACSVTIVPAPNGRWVCVIRWNENWQRKSKFSEKTCPSATLSTTNPTW